MEVAHTDLIHDPSEDPEAGCGFCHDHDHSEQVASFPTSIHAQLTGEITMLETRLGGPLEDHPEVQQGWEKSCYGCHATCGQCHISRPKTVGGGLVDGHLFKRTPSMVEQCTACHGSRVGEEFRGQHGDEIPGYKGDAHYLAGMRCEACHSAEEMHAGSGDHRFAVSPSPRCTDCHEDIDTSNVYHRAHMDQLSCTVCHAQDYKQCDSCHVPDGLDDASWLAFKIGKNPLASLRPDEYVTLRKIPIARDTYAGWGLTGELPAFDSLPTWKATVPHNIQRWTARTEPGSDGLCSTACHDTPATLEGWFLRQIDLDEHPEEAAANQYLIVPDDKPTGWTP